MEQDQEQPPSYSQSHDPESLVFPRVPNTDLPTQHHDRTLPSLSAALAESGFGQEPVAEPTFVWNQNPLSAYYQPGPSQLSPKARSTPGVESPRTMDVDTPDNRGRRGGSVLLIDDPDVRLAAEALGDLRSDFIHSPPQSHTSLPHSSPRSFQHGGAHPEPLLSLLTTSHPLIGTAIGGSLSAYSASKNYSPRFKSSVEYVERGLTPVVNTVGSINRITGVESGVRWFLGGRRPSHHQPTDIESGSNKRRKVGLNDDRNAPFDPYSGHTQELQHRQRRSSQASTIDTLPAYDEHRSPSYEATQQALITTQTDEPTSPGSSWQSRLVLSTSGLSVAMSEESLRSLKYCLTWLKWANDHIGTLILALKSVLEQFERGESSGSLTDGGWKHPAEKPVQNGQLVVRSDAKRIAMNAKIAELKKDVLKTLKKVVDIVSKYAGGALPENARVLVRRHLTSLPQRFKLASANSESNGEGADKEASDGANRVMVLAKEGLDMMAQVSGVLDGTIVSAEEWCERLGRKTREEREQGGMEPPPQPMLDAKMEGGGYLPPFPSDAAVAS